MTNLAGYVVLFALVALGLLAVAVTVVAAAPAGCRHGEVRPLLLGHGEGSAHVAVWLATRCSPAGGKANAAPGRYAMALHTI